MGEIENNYEANNVEVGIVLQRALMMLSTNSFESFKDDLAFACPDLDVLQAVIRDLIDNKFIIGEVFAYGSYGLIRNDIMESLGEYYSHNYLEYLIWWCLEVLGPSPSPFEWHRSNEYVWSLLLRFLIDCPQTPRIGDLNFIRFTKGINRDLDNYEEELYIKFNSISLDDWSQWVLMKVDESPGNLISALSRSCLLNRVLEVWDDAYLRLSSQEISQYHLIGSQLVDAIGKDFFIPDKTKLCDPSELLKKYSLIKNYQKKYSH